MENKIKVISVSIIFLATLIGILFSLMLFQSETVAIGLYVVCICLIMIIAEPFIGLLNYVLFLYLRPQEFIGAFRGMPLMLIMGGVTILIMFIRMALSKKPIVRAPQNFLILWLFAAVIMSQIAQLYLGGAYQYARLFMNAVFIYFMVLNLVDTERKMNIIFGVMIVLTTYLAVFGIYQDVSGSAFGVEVMKEGRIKGMGIFGDPNDLAMALLIVMPFILFQLFDSGKQWLKFFLVPIFLTLLYALYLTNSRGGIFGLAVLMSSLFSWRFGKKTGIIMSVLALLLIVALGPARMSELSLREDSFYGRVEAWAAGLSMFKSHPILGVGIGNYTDYHPLVAHNSFVHCAAELGLFGLIPWVMLVYLAMKNIYYVSQHAVAEGVPALKKMSEMIFFSLLTFVVTASFLSRTYSELLFLLIALSGVTVNMFIRETGNKYALIDRKDFLNVILIIFGGLVGLQIFLILYWA